MRRAAVAVAGAEWRRLLADRASLWVFVLLAIVLLASALSSGLDARAWRTHLQALDSDWQRRIATHGANLPAAVPTASPASPLQAADPVKAAKAAFDIARADAPPAVLPPLGGLALGSGGFKLHACAVRVTVESRHTDARREDRLANPLLQGLAMPQFATVVALLVPLAVICLCAGMVQQGREQKLWRLTLVQCPRVGLWLTAALGLRAAAVWCIGAAASCLAFSLDPGATFAALVWWLLALAGFVAVWTLVCALIGMLPVSAPSAVLLGIGAWLLTTFAVPAALGWMVDRQQAMPSRLAAIVDIRDAQQRAEADSDRLLAQWYAAHPERAPGAPATHTWPVSFMPRYLALEARIGPRMQAFDDTRARRYIALQRWTWLSPALSMAMLADELAGIDAPRHARYTAAVGRYEAQWRAFFVPRIMSYRGVDREDLARMPRFSGIEPATARGWRYAAALSAMAAAAGIALFLLRRRFGAG